MTARLYCSLVAVFLCSSVCWSERRISDDRFNVKPGVCPSTDGMIGLCAEFCSGDDDCPGDAKCCSNGCGHACTAPIIGKPKPGVCPKTTLEVAVAGVCVESCSHDSDCPNDEKCCSNGCGHQCTAPYTGVKPKPGVCPSKNPGVERPCIEACSNDRDCPKDEKCCSTGCGHRCTAPYKAKPGVCPVKTLGGVCKDSCVDDSDCPDTEKCCSDGCGRQCRAPYIDKPKPGVCPSKNPGVERPCIEACSNDRDCPKDEKCCSTGCGHRCTAPYKAKPGVCPVKTLGGVCKDSCVDDSDCPDTEKCCSDGCGRQCRAPYIDKPKPGVCPSKIIKPGVCTKSCSYDSDCPNNEKCCSTRCGQQCVKPGKCYPPFLCRQVDP